MKNENQDDPIEYNFNVRKAKHEEKHEKTAKKTEKKAEKKEVKKKVKRKLKKSNVIIVAVSILIIIALLIIVVKMDSIVGYLKGETNNDVIAEVNGEKITKEMLENEYNAMPAEMQMYFTKKDYLTEQMVPQMLLMQEVKKAGISDKEADDFLNSYIKQFNMTTEELKSTMEMQGKTLDDLKEQVKAAIFINKTITSEIEVSDEEIEAFYSENIMYMQDEEGNAIPLENISEQVKSYVISEKQKEVLQTYIDNLKTKADIKIFEENIGEDNATAEEGNTKEAASNENEATSDETPAKESTFEDTGDEICKDADGKPIIRLYSTTWCPHCKWVKETADKVMKEYKDKGLVNAAHYEVDVKDDSLTEEVETEVPADELALFKKYSSGGVPTYIFGCKYTRIGNGYEQDQDLAAEEKELREAIDKLLS